MAKSAPVDATDALRRMPGVEILPRRYGAINAMSGSKRLFIHGGMGGTLCKPDVYIDGMLVMDAAEDLDALVRPEEVLGFELYRNGTGVPAEFTTTRARDCGVLLVWTKR